MLVEFSCVCGKKFRVAEEHAGKRAKCRACGQTVTIPAVKPAAAKAVAPAHPSAKETPAVKNASNPAIRQPAVSQAGFKLAAGISTPPSSAAAAGIAPLTATILPTSKPVARTCPECGRPLSEKAVLCVHCGYNLKTGKKLVLQTVIPPDDDVIQKPRRPSPVTKFFTDRLFNTKVWAGLSMMALATIWFFGALFYMNVIFFYPPILFIIGAISFLSGLIDGASAG